MNTMTRELQSFRLLSFPQIRYSPYMQGISDSKAIFEQLADTDGAQGVRTVIENHEAWLQNTAVQLNISAAMRAQLARMPRPELVSRRIEKQRQALQSLVTRLPLRLSSAG